MCTVLGSSTSSLPTNRFGCPAQRGTFSQKHSWAVKGVLKRSRLALLHCNTDILAFLPCCIVCFSESSYSGPKRFDYDADTKTWFCVKEGETSTLHELLQDELSQVFDTDVEVLLQDE